MKYANYDTLHVILPDMWMDMHTIQKVKTEYLWFHSCYLIWKPKALVKIKGPNYDPIFTIVRKLQKNIWNTMSQNDTWNTAFLDLK